jgi:MerR family transcriptional regulator, light-induced transcriptional regulator
MTSREPPSDPRADTTRDAGPDPEPTAELVAELTDRFAAADRYGASAGVRQLLAQGVPEATIRDAVGLAQREVGRRWQAGIWTITQEHAATAVAEAVLAELEHHQQAGQPRGQRPTGRVAVVAAEGEWHALPVRLATHAFATEGLETVYLGVGLPASDVARTLPGLAVDALAVSVTMNANLVGAARTVAAGRAAAVPVLLGGSASTPARAAALGADAHAATVAEGARTVRAWATEGPPRRPDTPGPERGRDQQLRSERPRIIAAAYDHLEDRWSGHSDDPQPPAPSLHEDAGRPDRRRSDPGDQALEDLEQLVDHLTAAVFLDEPALLAEEVRWLAEVHSARSYPPQLLHLELDAIAAAVGGHEDARRCALAAKDGAPLPSARSGDVEG